MWYKKSRENWVQLGDRNTKFFHTQTLVRRKKNKIDGLFLEGGAWCIDPKMLKDEVVRFYKNLFFLKVTQILRLVMRSICLRFLKRKV